MITAFEVVAEKFLNIPEHMKSAHFLEWKAADGPKPTVAVVQKLHALHKQIHDEGFKPHSHPAKVFAICKTAKHAPDPGDVVEAENSKGHRVDVVVIGIEPGIGKDKWVVRGYDMKRPSIIDVYRVIP